MRRENSKNEISNKRICVGRRTKRKLIIGGYAQGKLDFALSTYHLPNHRVWDGVLPDKASFQEKEGNGILPDNTSFQENAEDGIFIINHFHLWVKNRMLEGGCPEEEIFFFLEHCKDCIIISDEIGNGIVPIDPLERDYRERVGRILIQLAQKAEEVWRVMCGIGQKIKG